MKNYKGKGETLEVTAPYNVASGAGVLVGAIFGVAVMAALATESVNISRLGEFTLVKATGVTTTTGNKAYWDNAAKKITSVAAGNTLVGVFTSTQGSGDTTVDVLLTGVIALSGAEVGASMVLNDLSDVTITTPANTEVLKYASGTTDWRNAADAT